MKNKVDSAILERLRANDPSLTSLNFAWNNISIGGIQELTEALRENIMLSSLDLGDNNMGDEEACEVAKLLKANKGLTSLDIDHNNIGINGARELAEALRENEVLIKLHLGSNNIGVEGTRELAVAIKEKSRLSSLNLSENNFGPEGARELASVLAIKGNSGLTSLDIGYNNIGDGGARELALAVQVNSGLLKLELSCNNIGYVGACELALAVQVNSGLLRLELSYNKIGYITLTNIASLANRNINNKIAEANGLYEQATSLLNGDSLFAVEQSLALIDQAIRIIEQVQAGSYYKGNDLLKTYIFSKAHAYNLLGQYDEALKFLDKVLEIDNNYQTAIQYRVDILNNKANYLVKEPTQEMSKELLETERGVECNQWENQEQHVYDSQLNEVRIIMIREAKKIMKHQQIVISYGAPQAELKDVINYILQNNPEKEQIIQQLTTEMSYLFILDELNTCSLIELLGEPSS